MVSTELDKDHVFSIDWVAVLGLFLLTRLLWTPLYFGIDRVNLAYSLEEFNPALHQPQPPGYPLFVAVGRTIDTFINNPHTTFLVISIGVSAASLPLLFAVAVRMFSPWAARYAVFLFVLNPAFWYTSLRSPLRPYLALFALLVAYCCWRCWNGERAYALWGALALGIGAGFRPDLLAYMSPLWVLSVWMGARSRAFMFKAVLVLSLSILLWAVPLFLVTGGASFYFDLARTYLQQQSETESIVFGSSWRPWLHQLSRLATWNGLAIAGWLWAVPFFLRSENRMRIRSPQTGFIAAWILPGTLIQALTHVAEPGHTLFSIAAFCILGGHVLHSATRRLAVARRWPLTGEVALGAALAFNTMIFMNVFPLPDSSQNEESTGVLRGWLSLRDALAYSMFETSRDQLMWVDDIVHTSLAEISAFTPKDRPNVIVSVEGDNAEFNFLNWRVASYYLPSREIWVLIDHRTSLPSGQWTRLVTGRRIVERRRDGALRIRVPSGGRIIWLMERDKPFAQQLSRIHRVQGGRYVFYVDLPPNAPRFNINGFEFVPDQNGKSKSG